MKQAYIVVIMMVCVVLGGNAYGLSSAKFDYKLQQYQQEQRANTLQDAMAAIGVDLSNVTIQVKNRGNTVAVNGSVPSQGDLDRINLVIKNYGPFRNERNYVKVKPYEAKDGMVVELDVFKHIEHAESATTNECTVAGQDDCDKLFNEREALLKQLRPLIKRTINDRYVVFDNKAAALVKRFCEVSDELDASQCYAHGAVKK